MFNRRMLFALPFFAPVAAFLSTKVEATVPIKKNGLRLSCNTGEVGYSDWSRLFAEGKRPHIFVDGKEIEEVITADENEGYIVHAVTDNDGRICVSNGEIVTKHMYGKVRIDLRDRV